MSRSRIAVRLTEVTAAAAALSNELHPRITVRTQIHRL